MSWENVQPSARLIHFLTYHLDDTDTTAIDPWIFLKRVLCHYLVDQVPDGGLEEILGSLKSACDFYTMPQPPARRIVGRSVGAKPGRVQTRPRFTIGTDEA